MRLIDADALVEGRVENDPIRIAVQCAPTAYNLDAVVEQLEEYAKSDVCYRHDGCPYRNNPEIKCENCGALGALDIVRNGGKE